MHNKVEANEIARFGKQQGLLWPFFEFFHVLLKYTGKYIELADNQKMWYTDATNEDLISLLLLMVWLFLENIAPVYANNVFVSVIWIIITVRYLRT